MITIFYIVYLMLGLGTAFGTSYVSDLLLYDGLKHRIENLAMCLLIILTWPGVFAFKVRIKR